MSIENGTIGQAVLMALEKWGGEVTLADPAVWPSFVEEVGQPDAIVAEMLARLRFRGFVSKQLVEHPDPKTPYTPYSLKYVRTTKQPIPALIDANEVSEKMLEAQERQKSKRAAAAVA